MPGTTSTHLATSRTHCRFIVALSDVISRRRTLVIPTPVRQLFYLALRISGLRTTTRHLDGSKRTMSVSRCIPVLVGRVHTVSIDHGRCG